MHSHYARLPRITILILSFILASVIVGGFFPTPNVVGGGTASMVVMAFVMAAFKIAIESVWSRWLRRQSEKGEGKPLD